MGTTFYRGNNNAKEDPRCLAPIATFYQGMPGTSSLSHIHVLHDISAYVYKTHRCYTQEFLLKFQRDRKLWLRWLFEVRKRYGCAC